MRQIPPEQLIGLAIPLTYAAMVAIERCCGTGWQWPSQRRWELLGVLCFTMQALINGLMSNASSTLLPGVHLLDAMQLGIAGSIAVGFLLQTFGNALLHRAYHRNDVLWRWAHQLHHAPARTSVAGVMVQSPLEMLLSALLFLTVTRFVLGLDPVATMACAWLASFYGMFQHGNFHTPRWLGWLIQRPEQHCEHHRRGVHAGNYSDFPIWDFCWGSFSNPADFAGDIGFEPAARGRVLAMLSGRDVQR